MKSGSNQTREGGRGETWFNTCFSTIFIRGVSQETHGPWIGTWLQLFGSTGYDTFFPLLQQWVACGIPYPIKILFEFVLHRHPLSISCLSTIEKTRVKNIIDICQIVHTYGWWWRAIGMRGENCMKQVGFWIPPNILNFIEINWIFSSIRTNKFGLLVSYKVLSEGRLTSIVTLTYTCYPGDFIFSTAHTFHCPLAKKDVHIFPNDETLDEMYIRVKVTFRHKISGHFTDSGLKTFTMNHGYSWC